MSWDKNGTQDSKSIHQYGSATQDKSSVHYDDQVSLYVQEQYKPTYFNESDLVGNISKVYMVP